MINPHGLASTGRYSSKRDMYSSYDVKGPIFHRIENAEGKDFLPAGRAHFFCSRFEGEYPWTAVIDNFGNLVKVPA